MLSQQRATRPAKLRRRHCIYCNALLVVPSGHQNKKFCCEDHRKAYHHEGMALGPMRTKIPKWITKEVAKQLKQELRAMRMQLMQVSKFALAAITIAANSPSR
jgi:hypothetical protein